MNLVLLIVGFILHWTFMESFAAVSFVMIMYITACLLNGPIVSSADHTVAWHIRQ